MLSKNPNKTAPANAGPEACRPKKGRGRRKIHQKEDKIVTTKIQRKIRKQEEKVAFTTFLRELAEEAAIAETARQIRKRKAEKAGFMKRLREIEQDDITDEKIDWAWNQYLLARALRQAHYERERFRSLNGEFKRLVWGLTAIENDEPPPANQLFSHREPAPNKASAERRAAIGVLESVYYYLLHRDFHSRVLYNLINDLKDIERHGAKTPEIFEPSLTAGRKSDDNYLQGIKGFLAGMAFVQMESGMSRQQAASWVARVIPSDLARRISSKPIIRSTVEEWMNQHGATLQVRRELKSSVPTLGELGFFDGKLPEEIDINGDSVVRLPELGEFLGSKYRARLIENNAGQFACLRMIYVGHSYLAAGKQPPFAEIIEHFQTGWTRPQPRGAAPAP